MSGPEVTGAAETKESVISLCRRLLASEISGSARRHAELAGREIRHEICISSNLTGDEYSDSVNLHWDPFERRFVAGEYFFIRNGETEVIYLSPAEVEVFAIGLGLTEYALEQFPPALRK